MPVPASMDRIALDSLSRRRFLSRSASGAAGLFAFAAWPQLASARQPAAQNGLTIRQQDPLNAEPPLAILDEDFLTPTPSFYIRNHGAMPTVDPASHRLKIEGLVESPAEFSLAELKDKFHKAECIATMTCAGNRRAEHNALGKVGGVQWEAGAIGNATWGGIKLSDLLAHCRLKDGAAHVWFDGADEIDVAGGMTNFGASIPLDKVLQDVDAAPGALVAWEMNGAALTPEHGRPLRTIVPGYIGARSVKWLTRIVVSDRPSPNHYVQSAYKLVPHDSDLTQAEANPVYRFPINVAICEPAADAAVAGGNVSVRGYALPTGLPDARIKEVEVSSNGGRRWAKARLIDKQLSYCWTRWEATVPVNDRSDRLVARAVDTSGGVTPDRVTWNSHGYLYNGWHAVPIRTGA